ncbi:MAG TPA: tetratricopeptide repeat protein [Polyangiaceae bacterium]|nr:tetratricopeptide repeat protein [Polyangiaceae bacterium]
MKTLTSATSRYAQYLPLTIAFALSATVGGCATGAQSAGRTLVLNPDEATITRFVRTQRTKCSWGMAAECVFTGQAYQLGLGVPRDPKSAFPYFQRACALGSEDGCVVESALRLERGELSAMDAVARFEKACASGSFAGCYAAGGLLTVDPRPSLPLDIPRGRTYLEKACAAKYLPACGLGAVLVGQLHETANYAAARQQLIEGCRLSDPDSCDYLARSELEGTLAPKDEVAAAHHFLAACRSGRAESCLTLAYLQYQGIGTSRDLHKAAVLVTQICHELRYEPACEVARHPERGIPAP